MDLTFALTNPFRDELNDNFHKYYSMKLLIPN